MLVDPQHQYIVFFKQFLKGGFYTGKFEHLLPQRSPAAAKEVSTLAEGKFLFHFSPASMPTTLIQAPAFSDAYCKEVSTPEKSAIALSTYVCTAMLSRYRKARFPSCTICSRNRRYTEKFESRDSSTAKRGFYMLILADWAVAISFYSLLNLLHPVWKSLSPSVFLSAGMWKPLFLHIIINK